MADPALIVTVPIAGIVALAFAFLLARYMLKKDTGSPEMFAIGEAIREGAMAYLARQYKTIAIVSIILGAIIMALIEPRPWVGVAFLLGAFCSALSGFIGMYSFGQVQYTDRQRRETVAQRGAADLFQRRSGIGIQCCCAEPPGGRRHILPLPVCDLRRAVRGFAD